MWEHFLRAASLLFILLNPFLLMVYLLDLIQTLDKKTFRHVLVRGALISTAVFIVFAWSGERVFSDVLNVSFAAFLIFGGVVFLVIGGRFVFSGQEALRTVRGEPEHLAGSIAMPFMIGPGTVSASIFAGSRLPFPWACAAIVSAIAATVIGVLVLKSLYEHFAERYRGLVNHYIDIIGRVSALLIGTIAVDMILRGLEIWWTSLKG